MESLLILWFILTFGSLAYVVWHNLLYNPVSWVQKLAWILVTAYAGVFGLLAYWFTCRTREGLTHDQSTQKTWQQAVNSEMHCLAGDATGIILSAAIVFHFGFPNGIDLIIEYTSAFIVGLFIFQALMMISMYDGDYWKAVRKTFFVETVSMNMVMIGMIPVMVILMHFLPGGDNPYDPRFWFTMGMATVAGGIVAFPVNYWFVAKKLKHGCMTLTPEGETEHTKMGPSHHESHGMHAMQEHQEHQSHQMGELPLSTQILAILGSLILLLAVAYVTTFVAPISFS